MKTRRAGALLLTLAVAASCSTPDEPPPSDHVPGPSPAAGVSQISSEQLVAFAELALACIDRPYPYKPHHVLTSDASLALPRTLHPSFYGCFDWHSAVHAHWMLLRLVKTYPDLPVTQRVRARLDPHMAREPLAREAAYFREKGRRAFERPYGWAWLLRLAAEVRTWPGNQGRGWAFNLVPLETEIVGRLREYLERLDWPIRSGTHPNTAFALAQALDYADAVGDDTLRRLATRRARDYYIGDENCPIDYEPGGEDFFSPCLLEADLMRRVLSAEEFSTWIDGFLPGLRTGDLGPVETPARVSDPSDPKIAHLDGLNLVRAWCLAGIATALPEGDPRRTHAAALADIHTRTGLAGVLSGHYEGEHWLASFAVYLVTGAGLDDSP